MASSGNTGLKRILKATIYSWQGFSAAYQHEEAFRQELLLALIMLPIGFILGDNGVEKALLMGTVILLPLVEILNSALEAVVDRFGGEFHELSGRAKDMGSAAVFLTIVLMLVTWTLVLFF
ncbi:MAG: diacylglycerol kinase [Gammaproteobacteria bacterium]|nr:diacylglycerol kinase [Gammaproteobacteria bacterium]